MGELKDFKCNFSNQATEYENITKGTDITFPEAYTEAYHIANLAIRIKESNNDVFCKIPFSHTVEAEAFGANIKEGDIRSLPLPGEKICKKTEELLDLPDMDLNSKAITEVLKACEILKGKGEYVAIDFCGPFTIMNNIIDYIKLFKTFKKDTELVKKVMWKFGDEVYKYMIKAKEAGVDFISYEDPMAGLGILGEPFARKVCEDFTADFIKKIEDLADESTMILLCPKTTFLLLGTENAKLKDVEVKSPVLYNQACIDLIGKVKIAGMGCIKNIGFTIKNDVFKEIVLTN